MIKNHLCFCQICRWLASDNARYHGDTAGTCRRFTLTGTAFTQRHLQAKQNLVKTGLYDYDDD